MYNMLAHYMWQVSIDLNRLAILCRKTFLLAELLTTRELQRNVACS